MNIIVPKKKEIILPPENRIIQPGEMAHRQGILLNRNVKVAGGGGSTDPATLPDIVSWHRGDIGVTEVAGSITDPWVDKTGNGHDINPLLGFPLVFETGIAEGQPAVRFGTGSLAILPTHPDYKVNNFTLQLVMQVMVIPSSGFEAYIMKTSDAGWSDNWDFGNVTDPGTIGFFSNGYTTAIGNSIPIDGNLHLYSLVLNTDGGTADGYIDGVLAASHGAVVPDYTFDPDIVFNGYFTTAPGISPAPSGSDFRILDMVFYKSVHSPTNISAFRSYASARYGTP